MLARWNPFGNGGIASSYAVPDFDSLLKEADGLLRATFSSDAAVPGEWRGQTSLLPPAELLETEQALRVLLDLPGHDPKGIQVRVEGDTLTIESERKQEKEVGKGGMVRSERSYGVFARSFVLPKTVDAGRCDARYENGVLTVTLPKREEAKPRAIEVKVHS